MTHTNIDTAAAGHHVPGEVVLSGRAVAGLVELLDHCHAFLDGNQTAQAELREYCAGQSYKVTTFWVVDRLAWHALLLRLQLAEQVAEDQVVEDRHG